MKKMYSCHECTLIDQRMNFDHWFNMASIMECVLNYVNDIARRLERGNHGIDCLDCLIFRLDWVINILVRYSDIEEIDPRVIDLLREVKDMLTVSHCTRTAAHHTCRIFTGLQFDLQINLQQHEWRRFGYRQKQYFGQISRNLLKKITGFLTSMGNFSSKK